MTKVKIPPHPTNVVLNDVTVSTPSPSKHAHSKLKKKSAIKIPTKAEIMVGMRVSVDKDYDSPAYLRNKK